MTRLVFGFAVFLLSCLVAVAQNPVPAPALAAAQPAVTSASSPAILEFQKIEDAWSNAINARDQYALELVLSPCSWTFLPRVTSLHATSSWPS